MEVNSIKELIHIYGNNKLVIPAIQRKYVWNEKKICDFFESIMREFPIGQILVWNIKGKYINEGKINFYNFLPKYDEQDNKINLNVEIPVEEEKEYGAILDGQQRIQSLIIGLNGSFKNKNSKKEKELYLKLSNIKKNNQEESDEYETNEELNEEMDLSEDDYEYMYEFKFLRDNEVKKSEEAWYKVKNILNVNGSSGIRKEIDALDKLRGDEEKDFARDILNTLKERMTSSNVLSIKNIPNFKIEDILEIFVRTNSGGEELSKSDLLFSTVVAKWNEGRDIIDNFLKEINNNGSSLKFRFTNDFIMRTFLYIEGANDDKDLTMKISNFDYIANNVKKDWDNISKAIRKTVNKLRLRGYSDQTIKAINSIIPIVYYFYNKGSSKKKDLDEIEKYIVSSQLNQIYGTASNTALKITRTILKNKKEFRLKDFITENKMPGNKTFIPTENDMKQWMNYKKGSQYSLLLLKILYDDIDMGKQYYHQDHVHPKKIIDEQNNKRFSELRDNIPNLELLIGSENEEKLATPLKIWLQNNPKKRVKYIKKNTSLEIEDFENFYKIRSENMVKELKKKFEI